MTTLTPTHLPAGLRDWQNKKNFVLMGIGPDQETCPNCGGFGTVMGYKIEGGPYATPSGRGSKWMDLGEGRKGWWKGELLVEHCPICQEGRLAGYLKQVCGMTGDDLHISLEDFRTDGECARKAAALADCRSIMAQNRQPAGFVTLIGEKDVNHGVGKTHLAKAMVNGFRNVGVWAKYTTLAELLADLHDLFGRDQAIRLEDLIERLKQIKVLVVDEIDKVILTGWDKQAFFRIIDYRSTHASELLTILIANAYQEDERLWIFDHDERGMVISHAWPAELGYLQSRILGGLVITVPGPDYRSIQGWAARQALQANWLEQEEEA